MAVSWARIILVCASAHWWAELGPRVSGFRALGVLGLVSMHWYVGAGPELSGGQDVSWDGCGLRESEGSLPAGGWGCVPAQLVTWCEVAQHWCQQAGGWCQVPALIS